MLKVTLTACLNARGAEIESMPTMGGASLFLRVGKQDAVSTICDVLRGAGGGFA